MFDPRKKANNGTIFLYICSNCTSFPMDPDEIIGKYIIVTYSCICFLLVSWLWPTSKLQDWEPGSSTEERVSRKFESDDNFCCRRLCSAPLASAKQQFSLPIFPAYKCFLISLSPGSLRHKEASASERGFSRYLCRHIRTELLNTDSVMQKMMACGGVHMIKVTMASLQLVIHVVQPPCWRARDALAQSNKGNYHFKICYLFVCLVSMFLLAQYTREAIDCEQHLTSFSRPT